MEQGAARAWVVRDQFGETWRLQVVASPAFPQPEAAPADGARAAMGRLLFGAFGAGVRGGDASVTTGLLRAYGALTADGLPGARDVGVEWGTGGLDPELGRTLERAVATGRLRVERVVPPPWPFHDEVEAPVSAPAPAPAPPPKPAPRPAPVAKAPEVPEAPDFDAAAVDAQVAALRAAAASGAPFCEECARAAAARAAAPPEPEDFATVDPAAQAEALRTAAADGTPFCEECERAGRANAAAGPRS